MSALPEYDVGMRCRSQSALLRPADAPAMTAANPALLRSSSDSYSYALLRLVDCERLDDGYRCESGTNKSVT